MPEHVHFPPDLEPLQTSANSSEKSMTQVHHPHHDGGDLSLANAVKRHVHFVYKQANQNQRRASKLLGISRATLSRHLRELNHK
jgi:transcriptional regulator with PAS, ATPase and Fis domain